MISEIMNENINCKTSNNMISNLYFMIFFIINNKVIVPAKKTIAPRYKFNNKKYIITSYLLHSSHKCNFIKQLFFCKGLLFFFIIANRTYETITFSVEPIEQQIALSLLYLLNMDLILTA